MKKFVEKHRDQIIGVIRCFDRIVFKGYLPISDARSMERFMQRKGVLFKDLKRFVTTHSERLKAHARATAEKARRPMIYCARPEHKDDHARAIAERDGITEGLVCVFSALEACPSFRVVPGQGRPRIMADKRKCLCLYFYYRDRELGPMHVRIQTWFPFTVQICLNGHEVPARQLDRHGIAYRKIDNVFTWIADCGRAQRMADNLVARNWPRIFSAFAGRVNGFNPAASGDIVLFAAVLRGQHTLRGFRNSDIRQHLFGSAKTTADRHRHRATVSHLLKRLHLHGLIAKIPRTRRWRVTWKGQLLMTAFLKLHHQHYPEEMLPQAA